MRALTTSRVVIMGNVLTRGALLASVIFARLFPMLFLSSDSVIKDASPPLDAA